MRIIYVTTSITSFDFEKAVRKAWELNIRRYVTEFWYTGSPAWKEDIDFAVKMMTEILDRQTV